VRGAQKEKGKRGGVPSMGRDGLPLCKYQAVLGDDCGNKDSNCLRSYYWRIAEGCLGLADF
jgi:hypothetical protein